MKLLNEIGIKGLLLNILKEIDSFCAKNDLTYYLAYGTLLGAVRHKGFIPWDDDIDICMPRPDYERFISTFKSNDSRYQVVSHFKDRRYPYFIAKVHDNNTVLEIDTTMKFQLGLYVDIFPIDAVPSNKKQQEKYIRKFNFYRNIYNIKVIKYNRKRNLLKNVMLLLSRLITTFIPQSFLCDKIDKISKTYSFADHELVSVAAVSDQRFFLDKALFSERVKLQFEDIQVNVPKGYTEILAKNYGDYFTMPPIEKRISHHAYKAYVICSTC